MKNKKVENGEIFTPPEHVEFMRKMLITHLKTLKDKFVLDAFCGTGNFTTNSENTGVLDLKLEYATEPEYVLKCLSECYGFDKDVENVRQTKINIYNRIKNFVKGFGTNKYDKEFLEKVKEILNKNFIVGEL